jgi:ubiquinone/menaquinone biosynthesis C-methylase UbiE
MKNSIKDKISNIEREKYWNEDYVNYWRARVEEANKSNADTSGIVAGDAKTSADVQYIEAISLLKIGAKDKVLELGCGFGRSLPMLCKAALEVTAVDISKEMVNAAKEFCKEKNVIFNISPSENMPFPDETFDVIVCFAAFDAMYQSETLVEINRVSKMGARVLITGKNDNYFDDDIAAHEAEVGARAKGHPNFFTDVKKLMQNLAKFGFCAEVQKYYLRRGDFANNTTTSTMPEMFYEYLLVLNKINKSSLDGDFPFADRVSKSFARQPKP